MGLQEANPRGAKRRRPYAACLKPGTCLTRLSKMISDSCILHLCMCTKGRPEHVHRHRYNATNPQVQSR